MPRAFVLVLLAGLLVLAACSDDVPTPTPDPAPTPVGPPTPDPITRLGMYLDALNEIGLQQAVTATAHVPTATALAAIATTQRAQYETDRNDWREYFDAQVATPTAAPAPDPAATPTPAPVIELIDLNTASIQLLDTLPGIGEILAERVFLYAMENGPIISVDQLLGIRGIGPQTVEDIRPLVVQSAPLPKPTPVIPDTPTPVVVATKIPEASRLDLNYMWLGDARSRLLLADETAQAIFTFRARCDSQPYLEWNPGAAPIQGASSCARGIRSLSELVDAFVITSALATRIYPLVVQS